MANNYIAVVSLGSGHATVFMLSLSSSITYSSIPLRSVPGFSGSCVGSVRGE